MSVNLLKGQKLSLNKGNPNLNTINVTLGWQLDSALSGHGVLDLDVSAFLLTASGKVEGPKDFVFYGNLKHPSGAVILNNNVTKSGNMNNVKVKLDLSVIPQNVMRIAFTATIYEAETRKQSFKAVSSAFISIHDEKANNEFLRYNLADKFNVETAVVFGEIYRNNNEWKFNAMGSGFTGGLAALCGTYGVEVG